MSKSLRIEYLADHTESIPLLAKWHHEQWSYLNPQKTMEQRIANIGKSARHDGIPLTVVGIQSDRVVGCASLVYHDMDTHEALSPWLASVYVDPEYRGKRIGSALVKRIVEEAKGANVKALYLYTPDRESFYTRLGWQVYSKEEYHGEDEVVMRLDLAD